MSVDEKKPELTILMPCLNEESTVGLCVDKAADFLKKNHIDGEILVADNGSSDRSAMIAKKHGAKVIRVRRTGYGRALRAGIRASQGKVIIMGDCDDTYDFTDIWDMYRLLADDTCDMVIGNRIDGNIEPGAMPVSHKIGVRALSAIGRCRFKVAVRDFHCGLRGVRKDAAQQMHFRTTGMEFATEMIAQAKHANLRIAEVPVVLHKCGYDRKSKLNTVRDGFRHLRYMLMSVK